MLGPRTQVSLEHGSQPLFVETDELLLGQALLELALNGEDAMPGGGMLMISVDRVNISPIELVKHPARRLGEFARIRVADTGDGIAPGVRDSLFEPFSNSADIIKNTGLGLTLVSTVVEQHQGWIECDSHEGHGGQFDLFIPVVGVPETEESTSAPPAARIPRDAVQTILLADPSADIRESGQSVLQEEGYRVLLAVDGVQALAIARQERERINLAILDLDLPRLPTPIVLDRLVELDPDIRVLLISNYIAEDFTEARGHTRAVLVKPFSRRELVASVRRALATAEHETSGKQ